MSERNKDLITKMVVFVIISVLFVITLCVSFMPLRKNGSQNEQNKTGSEQGGLVLSEQEEKGIALMSSVMPAAEYGKNGIAEQVESVVTLTATVQPDNTAENTGVNWDIKWKNVSSSWVTGKSVTDYVTATPNGEGSAESKTVTLANLQPFGEQIIVTATARDNPEVTASCTLDYAQKVTDFSVSFGNVNCNFGSKTFVTVELNENGTPTGGMPVLTPQKSAVYTIATETDIDYCLTVPDLIYNAEFNRYNSVYWLERTGDAYGVFNYAQFFSYTKAQDYDSISYATILNYSVAEKGLYFGVPFMVENMGLTFSGGGMGSFPVTSKNYTPASVIEMIEGPEQFEGNMIHYTNTANDMFTLTVTVQSKAGDTVYGTVTKETNFRMQNYTNISPVNGMNVDRWSYTF